MIERAIVDATEATASVFAYAEGEKSRELRSETGNGRAAPKGAVLRSN